MAHPNATFEKIFADDPTAFGKVTTRFVHDAMRFTPSALNVERLLDTLVGEYPVLGADANTVHAALMTLPEREQAVVRLRYGLAPMTLQQVGDRYGVSKERIRQIVAKAFRRLRHPRRMRILLGRPAPATVPPPSAYGDDRVAAIAGLFQGCDKLDCSVRASNALKHLKIETVWQLVQTDERTLMCAKNFGRASRQSLVDCLAAWGLGLGMTVDDLRGILRGDLAA